ncbi:MAG: FlgD immunoglobulin-like domain containing protein [bacterium]
MKPLLLLAAAFSWAAASPAAASWAEAPTAHVVLRADAPGPARDFVDALGKAGGHVVVLYPTGTAVVQAEPAVLASPEIARWIARADVGAIDLAALGPVKEEVARSARVWNLSLDMRAQEAAGSIGHGDHIESFRPQPPDAGPVPVALPEMPAFRDAPTHIPYGAQYYDTSSYLAGSTAVGVWLLEAAGSTYDWSQAEEDQTLAGVQTALGDWVTFGSTMASLSFVVEIHTGVPVSGVPIEHPQSWEAVWIGEALANAGWPGADAYQRCFAYNNAIRDAYRTNWCFSYFIVDSDPAVNQGLFVGGGYAWAYYGGPWVWMSRYSTWAYNWQNYYRAVPMHEMGHIYFATDEYDGVQQWSGYLDWNDNASTGVQCLMNQNDQTRICLPSRRQVAWLDLDGNDVMAPLDIAPTADLVALLPDPIADPTPTWSGRATVNTLANLNPNDPYNPPHDITLVKIAAVECRVDGGAWSPATAADGVFDAYGEDFTWTSPPLSNGVHVVEARAQTSAGVWTTAFDSDTVTVTGSPVAAPVVAELAEELRVVPNPARGAVELAWRVAEGPVALSIFDVSGRAVLSRRIGPGQGTLEWDGRDAAGKPVAAGVYVVRLASRTGEQTRRLVWMR